MGRPVHIRAPDSVHPYTCSTFATQAGARDLCRPNWGLELHYHSLMAISMGKTQPGQCGSRVQSSRGVGRKTRTVRKGKRKPVTAQKVAFQICLFPSHLLLQNKPFYPLATPPLCLLFLQSKRCKYTAGGFPGRGNIFAVFFKVKHTHSPALSRNVHHFPWFHYESVWVYQIAPF